MNTKTILKEADFSDALLLGPIATSNLWENIVIEKRTSANWIKVLYKDSILDSFFTVFFSKVH